MIWFFDRNGEKLRYEVRRDRSDGRYRLVITHPDGSKLSKANRDTSLRDLRASGWSAERLIGEAAYRAGMLPTARALPAHAVGELFAANGDNDVSAA